MFLPLQVNIMKKLLKAIRSKPISLLLVFVPLALAAETLHWNPLAVFIIAAVGVIPLAAYIGEATEALAGHTSPRVGALLNATLGNAAELIITITAIQAGLLELVKASITGSILGNLLLVMGLSMVVGGVKHGIQTFDRRSAGRNAVLLLLAVVALLVPSTFSHSIGPDNSVPVEALSIGVAIVMIVLYGLGLLDSARSPNSPITHNTPENSRPRWSVRTSVLILAVATLAIVFLSEILVGSVEAVVAETHMSEFFLGIILIPIIGNVAEHIVAVQFAARNKMELSVEIAVSSSLQIALFVAPLLVFISLAVGNPMQLIFNQFELIALLIGVIIASLVSADGESTWLEGAGLLAVYTIFALAFFLLP
jgi:Ca2+:H+ antiporter